MTARKRKVKKPRKTKQKHGRNWIALKKDWLTGEYASLRIFAEKKRISYGVLCQYAGKHKWREQLKNLSDKYTERVAFKEADLAAKAKIKHLKLAGLLIDKGSVTIVKKRALGVGHSLQAVKMGIDIERRTLDMDKAEHGVQNNTLNQILTIVGGDGGNGGNGRAEAIGRAIIEALRNGSAEASGGDAPRVSRDMGGDTVQD